MSAGDVLARRRCHYSGGPNSINSCCNTEPTRCQEEAENDLFALHAAGYVVAPVKPTKTMIEAAAKSPALRLAAMAFYASMIAAAKESPDDTR